MRLFFCLFLLSGALFAQDNAETETEAFRSFSDPSRIWGNGVEMEIEKAFRLCFRGKIIGGRLMNLRIPFAQNHERDTLTSREWDYHDEGKGQPETLWPAIEQTLASRDFAAYTETLGDGREKVIIFDIPSQKWSVTTELFELARMKAGAYRGLPHRPYVYNDGRGIGEADVYNYLYCVGLEGMDCSAFVWHCLTHVAKAGGLDLGRTLRRALGLGWRAKPALFAGTSFYGSNSREIIQVKDRIANLRPADVILFRSWDGDMAHSAIVQSIDWKNGVIRYLQCTDEAPPVERGVHESFIHFDPADTNMSLKDKRLVWSQKRYPPFPGERPSPFSDDGVRYRAYAYVGAGKVVRIRSLQAVINRLNRRK